MNKIINMLNKPLSNTDTAHTDRTFITMGGIDYIGGALFVLLALLCSLYIKKAKAKAEDYKARQLTEYKKQNPKDKNLTYEQTGMFLPPIERAKQFAPILGCITFALLALVFFTGKPISLI